MRAKSWTLPVVAALALPLGCGPRRATGPDIILVSIDSLRPDHLGCYGYERPTSPAIDRLAAAGARFSTAVSTTSWTLPAHAALFTSLFDSAHGLVDNGLRLGEVQVTLAEVLQEAGYHTAGFYGGPYLHPTYGLDQGFEVYRSCMTGLEADVSDDTLRAQAQSTVAASHVDVTGPRTVAEVQRWLDEDVDESAFFLFLHLWDVHYDYIPPAPYDEMFDPDYAGDLDANHFTKNEAIHQGMPARDLEHLLALYDGEIRFTDEILDQILQAVAAKGRLENALIVVTADHGEEFFEHGAKGHQNNLFDETLRVPLILRWPDRIQEGTVIEEQVRLIDIAPTLLSLADVALPEDLQGRDLTPLLRGETLEPEGALLELLVGEKLFRALRTDRHKLMVFPGNRAAFYDLRKDPLEKNNLPADSPGMRKAATQYQATLQEARIRHQRLGPLALETWEMDPAMAQQLEALGYIELPDPPSNQAPDEDGAEQ